MKKSILFLSVLVLLSSTAIAQVFNKNKNSGFGFNIGTTMDIGRTFSDGKAYGTNDPMNFDGCDFKPFNITFGGYYFWEDEISSSLKYRLSAGLLYEKAEYTARFINLYDNSIIRANGTSRSVRLLARAFIGYELSDQWSVWGGINFATTIFQSSSTNTTGVFTSSIDNTAKGVHLGLGAELDYNITENFFAGVQVDFPFLPLVNYDVFDIVTNKNVSYGGIRHLSILLTLGFHL